MPLFSTRPFLFVYLGLVCQLIRDKVIFISEVWKRSARELLAKTYEPIFRFVFRCEVFVTFKDEKVSGDYQNANTLQRSINLNPAFPRYKSRISARKFPVYISRQEIGKQNPLSVSKAHTFSSPRRHISLILGHIYERGRTNWVSLSFHPPQSLIQGK